ncbi:uncharacterized protein LOC144449107 [Glandiceps talaboti]
MADTHCVKSVIVYGVPYKVGDENEIKKSLIVHFQEKLNGGGEIDDITFPISQRRTDAAEIQFKNEVSDYMLQRTHEFMGAELHVVKKPPEPFIQIQGTVRGLFVNQMGGKDKFCSILSEKAGVKVTTSDSNSGECVVEGNQYQFRKAMDFIDILHEEFISSTKETSLTSHKWDIQSGSNLDRSGLGNTDQMMKTPHTKKRCPETTVSDDEKVRGGHCYVGNHDDQKVVKSKEIDTWQHDVQQTQRNEELFAEDTITSLKMENTVYAYIQHVHKHELDMILNRYHVTLSNERSGNCKNVSILSRDKSNFSKEKLVKAKNEICTLYERIFFEMKHCKLQSEQIEETKLKSAGGEVQMKHPRVLTRLEGKTIMFFGEEDQVQAARATAEKYLGIYKTENHDVSEMNGSTKIETEPEKPRGRRHGRHHRKKSNEKNDMSETTVMPVSLSRGPLAGKIDDSNGGFVITTSEDLTISVKTGDLTKEKTDVIVNAANEHLDHGGGLARCISQAAGPKLQSECYEYLKEQGRLLQVADTMHSEGYNLPCKHVIHAVGPKWNKFDKEKTLQMLKRTFLNCLMYAEKSLGARSISIPTISSGIFGVPKPQCANVLFDAVEEFITCPQRVSCLREINLVNNDQESTDLIISKFRLELSTSKY